MKDNKNKKLPVPAFIIDDLIKRGKLVSAKTALRKWAQSRPKRSDLVTLAAFSRRVGLPLLGVKVLFPVVRAAKKSASAATSEEKFEYAANLIRIGAAEEALGIIRSLDGGPSYERLLFTAFALIEQWDYRSAIEPLTQCLELAPGSYERCVVLTNLAAAHLAEKSLTEAGSLLEELLARVKLKTNHLLHGNAAMLMAQWWLLQNNFSETHACLNRAESLIQDSKSIYALLIQKWRAMAHVKAEATPAALAELERVAQAAKELGFLEIVRHCDQVKAVATRNEALMKHVYFGTRFPELRRYLRRDFGEAVGQGEFHWILKTGEEAKALRPRELGAELGQTGLRLLMALCSDFYKPWRTFALYQAVFPGEYFNPDSSPHRLRVAILRLRKALAQLAPQLQILQEEGAYRLSAEAPFEVILGARESSPPSKTDAVLEQIQKVWPRDAFNVTMAEELLSLPKRVVQRRLKDLVDTRQLQRRGNGSATSYRCLKHA